MHRRLHLLLVSLFICGGTSVAHAAPPKEKAAEAVRAKVVRLIDQMGDTQFTRRSEATTALLEIGLPATKTIENYGLNHSVREIRFRCESVLKVLHQQAYDQKLKELINTPEDAVNFDFPGWKPFQEIVGSDITARRLFVKMLKAEPEQMKSLQVKPVQKGVIASSMVFRIRSEMRRASEPRLGSVALILFLSQDPNANVQQFNTPIFMQLLSRRNIQDALKPEDRNLAVRKLFGRWLQREQFADLSTMRIASANDIKESVGAAKSLLKKQRGNFRFATTGYPEAIQVIGRLGDKSDLPFLESLLENKTIVGSFQIKVSPKNPTADEKKRSRFKLHQVQLRDIALAASLHLSKQSYKEYGFYCLEDDPRWKVNMEKYFLSFEDEKKREEAMKKWGDFRALQQKKENSPM